MLYLTGDTHADFGKLWRLAFSKVTEPSDIVVILGDSGINYLDGGVCRVTKENLSRLPFTLFCIHGNHEKRASAIDSYKEIIWNGGIALVEDKYPNLIFAKDGEVYNIEGHSVLTIGGAYSPDKEYRISHGYPWFSDEQPSEEIKSRVQTAITKYKKHIDVVLTHTCPNRFIPYEELTCNDMYGDVDTSTEEWLGVIEADLDYDHWFCGHYHIDKDIDKLSFLFNNVVPISNYIATCENN